MEEVLLQRERVFFIIADRGIFNEEGFVGDESANVYGLTGPIESLPFTVLLIRPLPS